MPLRLSKMAKIFLLAAPLALIAPVHSQPLPVEPAAVDEAEASLSPLPPEVRIRKLHLVRPDLIPFPIAYETYC
jgi:hypothetical protein